MQVKGGTMGILTSFICVVFIFYLFIVLGMYLFQRTLMYHPERADLDPARYAMANTQAIRLKSPDGVHVTVWHHPAHAHMPTIIYFHGNAAHLGSDYRRERFSAFAAQGYGVLALSYRGYGDSEGTPSEDGMMDDARTTIRYAKDTLGLGADAMILFGESLGSGIAVRMATEFAVRGVVLDSPYTSAAHRASEIYPWLPVHLIMKDTFNSIAWIEHVHVPLMIFHGANDTVIPVQHGKQLFHAANEPKWADFPLGVGHVDVPALDLIREMGRFFRL